MKFTIDPDFQRLSQLWPLTEEERANLKASIEQDGVRDPGTVWDGMLLDGHNRFEICSELGKSFPTVRRDFASRDEAMLWVLSIDESRRNLQPIDKVARAEFKRPILERLGIENKGTRTDLLANLPKGSPVNTRDALAAEVGVSPKTYDALKVVTEQGSPELIQAVREKKTSASSGAELAKSHTPEQQTQIIRAAETSGESVRKTVAKVARESKPKPKVSTLFICQTCDTQYTDGTTECDCTSSVAEAVKEDRPANDLDAIAIEAVKAAPNRLKVARWIFDNANATQRKVMQSWFEGEDE